MENEARDITLQCKGEDYKDCVELLHGKGFVSKGFNEWSSPFTGNRYRLIVADGGKYVTRVELVTTDGQKLVNTEFCDRKMAIKKFEMENVKQKAVSSDEIKQGVINAVFKLSPSRFTKDLQCASEAGDSYIDMLYEMLGLKRGDRISVKQYLFVYDGVEGEAIAVCSEYRRYDRQLLRVLTSGSKKLYLYRALRLPEDMIDSLLSRVQLERLLGADEVQKLRCSI